MRKIAPAIMVTVYALMIPGWAVAQQEPVVHDKDIRVVDFVDLTYPMIADSAHTQGVVVVRVKLDDSGKVVQAEAISGADLLIRASVDNAKQWRFEPNSQKAAVIVYNFRIEGFCHPGAAGSQMIFYPPNLAEITACGRNP
jgi:TonB family protein